MKAQIPELIITADGSHSLHVPDLDETYHSVHGAVNEANHVYIDAGLKYWHQSAKSKQVSIFEVGFGTGLNCILSIIYGHSYGINISYHTIEANPLPQTITKCLNYAKELGIRDTLFQSIHKAPWGKDYKISGNTFLKKINLKLEDYIPQELYDVIYFDAFAPSKQPEMWSCEILKKCYDMLANKGVFVTYSAKGQLQRDLKKIGFEVETIPGPPKKYEMIRASKV